MNWSHDEIVDQIMHPDGNSYRQLRCRGSVRNAMYAYQIFFEPLIGGVRGYLLVGDSCWRRTASCETALIQSSVILLKTGTDRREDTLELE